MLLTSPEKLLEPHFQALLWPAFRAWIQYHFNPAMHLVMTTADEKSLIVVDKHPDVDFATLQTLSGSAKYELLSAMETHLRKLHTHTLGVEWENTENLELPGWQPPQKKHETYYFDMLHFNPSWMQHCNPLPLSFSLLPWEETTLAEKEQLEKWAEMDHFLLSPKEEPLPRENLNSLILKKGAQIAGWVETHRKSGAIIRYTSLFVFKEFRGQKVALPLLVDSLRRHILAKVPIATFTLNLEDTPSSWRHFVKKKLAPHAYHVTETLVSFKSLNML